MGALDFLNSVAKAYREASKPKKLAETPEEKLEQQRYNAQNKVLKEQTAPRAPREMSNNPMKSLPLGDENAGMLGKRRRR